ncbi:hypothetical protein ACNKHU_14945 [Shigella flexneri]
MRSWITSPMCLSATAADGRYFHEVCSLAGTLGLGKLIGFYDHNGIPSTVKQKLVYRRYGKTFCSLSLAVIHENDGQIRRR